MAPDASKTAAPESVEDGWHAARLIPTVGIRNDEEREKRATSSLLAVLGAVPEFGRAIVGELGAPRGRISTYTEVQLKDPAGKVHIPDGAIVAERGKSKWRCLVEVKTRNAPLSEPQVNRYLDLAREHGLDAVLTISNQITPSAKESPVDVDRRKLRHVKLYHLSWWRILTEAIVQHRFHGISDPDQAWILGELVAYLDAEGSGASGFQDMGDKWVKVRNGAAQGTLRPADSEVREVAERWDQFVEYLCLGLGQDLGAEVRPLRPRKQTTFARHEAIAEDLAESGKLKASLRVPDAIAPIAVEADLRTRQVTTSVVVKAPRQHRPLTRVSWMLRQLEQAPSDLRVEVSFANVQETSAVLLSEAHEDPRVVLSTADPKRQPRSFRLTLARPMGTKRGKGERSFVRDTRQQTIDFYRKLVQDLRAWQAPAPKLPEEPAEGPLTPEPTPPPFSAGDEREPGEGIAPADDRTGVRAAPKPSTQ
jgi:hypothetical protein